MQNYYDFMFREYSQVQGRWMSPDPAGMAATNPMNPQSWNRYVYVTNNPLASIDALGLDDKGCVDDGSAPTDVCAEQGSAGGGGGDNWDGFAGSWQGAWLDASQSGVIKDLAAFAAGFQTFQTFGYSYFDLPGKEDPTAQAPLRFGVLENTGYDLATGILYVDHFTELLAEGPNGQVVDPDKYIAFVIHTQINEALTAVKTYVTCIGRGVALGALGGAAKAAATWFFGPPGWGANIVGNAAAGGAVGAVVCAGY